MNDVSGLSVYQRDPRIAAHAAGAAPAWLWNVDGRRVLWANAAGAAVFGAPDGPALAQYAFDAADPTASQISRVAATLSRSGASRLERLRGFGGSLGGLSLCACARLEFAGRDPGVLVVAQSSSGVDAAMAERVRRLSGSTVVAGPVPAGEIGASPELIRDAPPTAASHEEATPPTGAAMAQDAAPQDPVGQPMTASVLPLPIATPEPQAPPAAPQEIASLKIAPQEITSPETVSPETVATSAERAEVPPLRIETPVPDRRHPLRFVWQMDPDGRFTVGSDEFTEVIGPQIATSLGRRWRDVADDLALDPEHQVERAVATRDTWSGITVSWPVDGAGERLKVELSGLPAFDRHRNFLGYRGFGVCRDVDRIATLSHMRRLKPFTTAPQPLDDALADDTAVPSAPAPIPSQVSDAPADEPPARDVMPAVPSMAQNVVPFRVLTSEPRTAEIKAGDAKPHELAVSEPEQRHSPRLAERKTALSDDEDASPAESAVSALLADGAATAQPSAAEAPPAEKIPSLSVGEQSAFHELARRLNARLNGDASHHGDADAIAVETSADHPTPVEKPAVKTKNPEIVERRLPETALFDHLPVGVLVFRFDHLLYANKSFLASTGYADIEELRTAGGLDSLVVTPLANSGSDKSFTIDGRDGVLLPHEAKLVETTWNGDSANVLVLAGPPLPLPNTRSVEAEAAQRSADDTLTKDKESAETASSAQGELLAKIGRRIRAPLTGIKESAGVVAAQQFGPLGHDRYRDYLADILAGSEQAGLLVDNLIRLTDIEAGRINLTSVDVHLNEMVQGCVVQLQADATRDRVIVRTSLAPALRPVIADVATMKEVLCTLVEHALRLTGAGGQVIISTAQKDNGDVVLHVRDTGIGMNAEALKAALDGFHDNSGASGWDTRSVTLALPLAKALAEANQATFCASSTPGVGTLIEIAFPAKRVLER